MSGFNAPAPSRHPRPAAGRSQQAQAGKEKFGLNNPARVRQIEDHGESIYRADNGGCRRTIVRLPDVDVKELLAQIGSELDEHALEHLYFADPTKKFVPRDKFAEVLTPESVLQLVSGLDCFRHVRKRNRDTQLLAQDICFGSSRKAPYLKVLGVLIGIDKPNDIKAYMDEGMSDDCLPLRYKYFEKSGLVAQERRLVCRHPNHDHKIVNGYRRGDTRDRFIEWTRRLMAPYIKSHDRLHSHYVIEKGACLPMFGCEGRQPTEQTTRQTEPGAYGGYSNVHKVRICKSHCNFGQHGLRNPQGYYALKQLTSSSRKNFNLELSSLLFAADQGGSRNHLIQLLATFEEYNPIDRTSTFFLLFDWAQGDLDEFWRSNQRFVRDTKHCPWMAEQFLGLAEALQTVHNDRVENLKHLPESISDRDLYGRHGDIKPENLLWFDSVGLGSPRSVLTLADFGLGRLHTKVSRSKQDPNGLPRTETYRSPEFDMPGGLVSPVSDVFSLGCVFLEYITWFLLGYDAVKHDFNEIRKEIDIYGFEADTFFNVSIGHDNRPIAVLKPTVKAWIQKLRAQPECTWYVRQTLELIESEMLEPRREDRMRALPLVKELRKLAVSCRREPSFYLRRINSSG